MTIVFLTAQEKLHGWLSKKKVSYVGITACLNDGDEAFQLCIVLSNEQAALKKAKPDQLDCKRNFTVKND